MLLASSSACKKDNTGNPPSTTCDSCYCRAMIDTLQASAAETDSALVSLKLTGLWDVKCVSFSSKYGITTLTKQDSVSNKLSVQFTDSTYTYFKNDSLLFTFRYFVSNGGYIYANSNSFYYGALGGSLATFKSDELGINTVYPYTGSYYLTFKRRF